jgi:HSP20 family protein
MITGIVKSNRVDPYFDVFGNVLGRILPKTFVSMQDLAEMTGFSVDVKSTPESYEVSAEVPGVNKEDLKIDFQDNVLSITVAASKENEIKEGESLIISERSYSTKSRYLTINDDVDENNIQAEYNNGILKVVLPKKQKVEQTKKLIEIK